MTADADVHVSPAEPEPPSRFHAWLPMAIVAVSVLAAIMGWRASVADENSNHDNELSRQELIRQQQLRLADVQEVNAEARVFGRYEQYSLLAQTLRAEARELTGAARSAAIREADSNLALAASLGGDVPTEYAAADGVTLDPAHPYRINASRRSRALSNDELQALDPERLRRKAERTRRQGEYLTGLAALFVAAIVLFTLAAVSRGRPERSFSLSGVVVALVGVALFVVVEVS